VLKFLKGKPTMLKLTAEVRLAERYASALERIKALEAEIQWTEDDVRLAEGYLDTLQAIEETPVTWRKRDAEEASTYLRTLQEIEEYKDE
jgi:hypothetical protein